MESPQSSALCVSGSGVLVDQNVLEEEILYMLCQTAFFDHYDSDCISQDDIRCGRFMLLLTVLLMLRRRALLVNVRRGTLEVLLVEPSRKSARR